MSSLHFPSRRVCFSFQDSIRAFLGHPDLPFSDVLDAETIRSVFAKHRCSLGDSPLECGNCRNHCKVVCDSTRMLADLG